MINNLDAFFYYGTSRGDIDVEIKDDIKAGVIQKKRSIYYNRQYGSDITRRENYPNTSILTISFRYDVINWIVNRNENLPALEGSQKDRRVAVSQSTINFFNDDKGNVEIDLYYIPFSKNRKADTITLPVGVN